jgi:hypothetical protein
VVVFVMVACVASCATAGATVAASRVCRADALQPGLYKVVQHECEQPQGRENYCPLIEYIELRRGADFRVAAPLALVEWFVERPGSTDYAYEVEPLSGHCGEEGRYILDSAEHAEAWLELDDGVPQTYVSSAYAQDEHTELVYRVTFALSAVERDAELDRLLHVE